MGCIPFTRALRKQHLIDLRSGCDSSVSLWRAREERRRMVESFCPALAAMFQTIMEADRRVFPSSPHRRLGKSPPSIHRRRSRIEPLPADAELRTSPSSPQQRRRNGSAPCQGPWCSSLSLCIAQAQSQKQPQGTLRELKEGLGRFGMFKKKVARSLCQVCLVSRARKYA